MLKILLQIGTLILLVASAQNGPDKNSLGGVDSVYTGRIYKAMSTLENSKAVVPVATQEINLYCYQTPTDHLYIGNKQQMVVEAPLSRVIEVVDDIAGYKELFPGFVEIRVESKEGSKWLTYWEQRVPIPFVPNVKYRMIYEMGNSNEVSKTYRYQLKEKSSLVSSDGFIILQALETSKTLYTEVDFFNANWGAAKIFGNKRIWSDSIQGLALSDLAIKLKSENSDWDSKKIRNSAKQRLKSEWIDDCVSKQLPPDL